MIKNQMLYTFLFEVISYLLPFSHETDDDFKFILNDSLVKN